MCITESKFGKFAVTEPQLMADRKFVDRRLFIWCGVVLAKLGTKAILMHVRVLARLITEVHEGPTKKVFAR
jgi:hypothetical protein